MTFRLFIPEAGPLQLNRQPGQAASDSLTVCLNSGWRLCFHTHTKGAQLPGPDPPSLNVGSRTCVRRGSIISLLTSNREWQTGFPACEEKESEWSCDFCSHPHLRARLTPEQPGHSRLTQKHTNGRDGSEMDQQPQRASFFALLELVSDGLNTF